MRDQLLTGLAGNTGGMRQNIITASSLENWMKIVASCLTSQYVVTPGVDATPAKMVQVALRQDFRTRRSHRWRRRNSPFAAGNAPAA